MTQPADGDLRMCLQVRGLAHPEHWQGPQGALFDRFGAVKASPLAAYKLLRQRESVLLFPGGGREVRARLKALQNAQSLRRVEDASCCASACLCCSFLAVAARCVPGSKRFNMHSL